jgi:hypothetical protein
MEAEVRTGWVFRSMLVAVLGLAGLTSRAVAQPAPSAAPGCDLECLTRTMDRFVAVMTRAEGELPLAAHAEIRENAAIVRVDQTTWRRVKAVRSSVTFADELTGNVVSRAGVELDDGTPGYLSTRLRLTKDGRITDVEISADTSAVVGAYVWNLTPVLTQVLPPEQRLSRVALEALARRYFGSLSSHQAVAEDFDPSCNRFHSGQQITNVARNSVEGGAPRTCAGSVEGNPPWGPATEQRFPVIDADRGIVVGITLLHYLKAPQPAQMYVSEVFKVVDGRIVHIDNIGLMMQGTVTLGFVH